MLTIPWDPDAVGPTYRSGVRQTSLYGVVSVTWVPPTLRFVQLVHFENLSLPENHQGRLGFDCIGKRQDCLVLPKSWQWAPSRNQSFLQANRRTGNSPVDDHRYDA